MINPLLDSAKWWTGSNKLRIKVAAASEDGVESLTLTPQNAGGAEVRFFSSHGSVQVHVGKAIRFDEIDALVSDDGAKLSSLMSDEMLADFLAAIFSGHVSETLGTVGGDIVSNSGEIEINGKVFRIRSSSIFQPAARVVKIRYSAV